jgi:hypothetical protein
MSTRRKFLMKRSSAHLLIKFSHKEAQKAQNRFLSFLCFFVAKGLKVIQDIQLVNTYTERR